MYINRLFHKAVKGLDKREIFLIGFYISFLSVMTIAALLDFAIQNYQDAYIESIFILLTLLSFWHYRQSKNRQVAIYSIVLLATFTTYALLISNEFNISIFHSIVPLGYFLLFSLKRSLLYTLLHQSIVISIYIYGYYHYPDNAALHNPAQLTATAMASLMIILFGLFYHLAVENSYAQLARSNRQKEILLKEVHHRVKNNLNVISSILGLQVLGKKDPLLVDIIQKNRLRIDSIAMVHELLYKHDDFEVIDVNKYLTQLSKMVTDLCEKEITVHFSDSTIYLPFEQTLKLGIITNELLTNSIKHAFEGSRGEIKILLTEVAGGYLYHYEDNSTVMIDHSSKKKEGLGLRLIEMMTEQMEAELHVSTKKGIVYEIRIGR